jgi:hypothetical protein
MSEAVVKQMEPQKNVTPIQSAEEPSAATEGTRNIVEPAVNSAPIHHAAFRGRQRHMA